MFHANRLLAQPNQDRDDDVAFEVIRYAEELVGEDRYAGAWIDRSSQHPVLGMAFVAPEAAQVTSIQDEARRAGWSLTIDVVKYSRAQLISFYDGLEGPKGGSVMAFRMGPAAKQGCRAPVDSGPSGGRVLPRANPRPCLADSVCALACRRDVGAALSRVGTCG
jgi:hypothetical protein